MRGQPADYDGWAAGAAGWNWVQAERLFRKIEAYEKAAGRGHDGPMRLHEVSERYPVAEAFLKAAQQDGQPLNPDYNAGSQEGVATRCCSTGAALERGGRPETGLGRPNDGRVRRAHHAAAVRGQALRRPGLSRQGRRAHGARARERCCAWRGAIAAAAGAVGRGRSALLARLGIPLAHALPQVGENYIDHYATRMNWRVKNTVTLNEMSRGWRLARQVALRAVAPGHPDAGHGLAHGFVKSAAARAPDVQFFFVHASYANAAERILDRFPGMTIGVAQLRPNRGLDPCGVGRSAGRARHPPQLPGGADRPRQPGGGMRARAASSRPALQPFVAAELSPGKDVQSDDEWLDFARQNGQTIYHPIGTCRMGADADAVTDSRLRVNGLDGLRVVDASVMPRMVSGNTQAAVMMVAERGAELILEDAARAG